MKHGKPKVKTTEPAWTAFQRAWLTPEQEALVNKTHRATLASCWVNSRYEVWIFEWSADANPIGVPLTQLSIKRRDKGVARSWRDFQRVKNELVGPAREAVELYPSEARLMDTANQFHLWCLPEDQMYPFGYWDRIVAEGDAGGAKQEPFDADVRPSDLVALDDVHKKLIGG